MLVASSEDSDPLGEFEQLFNAEKPPSLFHVENVSTEVTRVYVLLHDNVTGDTDKVGGTLYHNPCSLSPLRWWPQPGCLLIGYLYLGREDICQHEVQIWR